MSHSQSKYNFVESNDNTMNTTGTGFLPSNYNLQSISNTDAYNYNNTDLDLTDLINPSIWSLDINDDTYNNLNEDYNELDASISSVLAALDEDDDIQLVANNNNNTNNTRLYDDIDDDASGWANAPISIKPAINASELESQFVQKVDISDTQNEQVQPTVGATAKLSTDLSEHKDSAAGTTREPTPHLFIPLGRRTYNYMSKSELAFVIKSQLNQLQPSDILNDDFYYQVHSARHSKQVATFSNVLPIMRAQYKNDINRKFDSANTLGKIAASNLRKPKKAMELNNLYASNHTTNMLPHNDQLPAKTNIFNNKSIHYLIEEGIRVLMDIEDIDSVMSSTTDENERNTLTQRRHLLVDAIADSLDIIDNPADTADTNHLLYTFVQYSTGRLLLFRSLLLMQQTNYTSQIIAILLIDIYQLITQLSCNANDDRLISVICDTVYSTDIPISIDLFGRYITSNNVHTHIIAVLQCKLGMLLLQVFLKKGHEINQHLTTATNNNAPPHIIDAITNDKNTWHHYYNILLALLHGRYKELFYNLPRIDIRQSIVKQQKLANKSKLSSDSTINESTLPLSTTSITFEFMAALLSHATFEQRKLILPDIQQLFDTELQLLTKSPFTQPLSNAIRFIFTLLYPDRQMPQPVESNILVTPIDRVPVQNVVPAYANALKQSVQPPFKHNTQQTSHSQQQQSAPVLAGWSPPATTQSNKPIKPQPQYKPNQSYKLVQPQYASVTIAQRPTTTHQ